MQISTERILTTHVGSLPRPEPLGEMLLAVERGDACDAAAFAAAVADAVADIVARQVAWGIDIVSDGEMSKTGYATYVQQRFEGFSGEAPSIRFDDLSEFPVYRRIMARAAGTRRLVRPCCTGPVRLRDRGPLDRDLANFAAALAGSGAAAGFLNAASPGVIAIFQSNAYYPSDEAYLAALAEAMAVEYEAIVGAGFLLQVDCPDLAMGRHTQFRELSEAEFLAHAELQIDALNAALANVPAARTRMHVCWGNYEGPHHKDIALDKLVPLLNRAKPQAISFEAANPRHEHEWTVFADGALADDKVVIPGVVDSVTNYIEHPELVAQRLERFAGQVGRERVIAGVDCGFATFAGIGKIDPAIAVEKLKALVEGAAIASDRLWSAR